MTSKGTRPGAPIISVIPAACAEAPPACMPGIGSSCARTIGTPKTASRPAATGSSQRRRFVGKFLVTVLPSPLAGISHVRAFAPPPHPKGGRSMSGKARLPRTDDARSAPRPFSGRSRFAPGGFDRSDVPADQFDGTPVSDFRRRGRETGALEKCAESESPRRGRPCPRSESRAAPGPLAGPEPRLFPWTLACMVSVDSAGPAVAGPSWPGSSPPRCWP